jgi:hypothetical protein
MMVRAPSWVSVSMMTLRLGSSADAEDLAAAHAVERLEDDVACSSMKAWMSAASRATRVAG